VRSVPTDDVIVTGRFTLQPLRVADAQEMVAVLADAGLYAFIGGSPPTLDELEARYQRQVAGPGTPGVQWLNWIIRRRYDGRAIGYVQAALSVERDATVADLAWLVGTEFQGAGAATEATSAVIGQLRARGVDEVRAHIVDGHDASAGVARRLGLMPTDELDAEGERLYVMAAP
jgi:RimJ/RimL family protein N-acetyltransferase